MHRSSLPLLALVLTAPFAAAEPPDLLAPFTARSLGPANMSGRICDVAVVEIQTRHHVCRHAPPAACGRPPTPALPGRRSSTVMIVWSIGAVAVAPSNPNVVWVGTGEANARNSVSWGDGVYKSTDGGKTWTNMGLKDTRHIGRDRHPSEQSRHRLRRRAWAISGGRTRSAASTRPATAARPGSRSSSSTKTPASSTWPWTRDPEMLYAAPIAVRRDGLLRRQPRHADTGTGSGLFKTTDGGKTWQKMTKGLPDRPLGRCGLAVYRKDPRSGLRRRADRQTTSPIRSASRPRPTSGDVDPAASSAPKTTAETWKKVNDLCPRPFYYGQIRIDPNDDQRVYVLGVPLFASDDGGKTFRTEAARRLHADHHALWIDPARLRSPGSRQRRRPVFLVRPRHQLGAVAEPADRPVLRRGRGHAQAVPRLRRLAGQRQLGRPSRHAIGATASRWPIGSASPGGDGFQAAADPNDLDTVYCESQYGGLRARSTCIPAGRRQHQADSRRKTSRLIALTGIRPILFSPHNPTDDLLWRQLPVSARPIAATIGNAISPDLTLAQAGPGPIRPHDHDHRRVAGEAGSSRSAPTTADYGSRTPATIHGPTLRVSRQQASYRRGP